MGGLLCPLLRPQPGSVAKGAELGSNPAWGLARACSALGAAGGFGRGCSCLEMGGKLRWQMQGLISCAHPQGPEAAVCHNPTPGGHSTEGYPGKQERLQLSARNSVSKGKHTRGFVRWPGRVWAWSSFIYSSISGALLEIPRWEDEDEEEAQLQAAAFSQSFSLPPGSRGRRASWHFF